MIKNMRFWFNLIIKFTKDWKLQKKETSIPENTGAILKFKLQTLPQKLINKN